jgi:hypothetical protein
MNRLLKRINVRMTHTEFLILATMVICIVSLFLIALSMQLYATYVK